MTCAFMKHRLRALITGASSGLGREMSRQLAQRGWRVAITGRREDDLRESARQAQALGAECLQLVGSVTELKTVKRHYAAIREGWGGLDLAILNAGIGDPVDARHFKAEIYHRVLATNVGGVVNWLEVLLPDMVAAGSGTIAGISSLAAWRGFPNAGAYSASKAALFTLLESTRVDLRGTGVRVVTVCPGFIKNGSGEEQGKPFVMELEAGVRCILRGIERRRRIVHFPWQLSYLMKYVVHNMPGFSYDWLISKLARPRVPASKPLLP
jgi:NAD(P)-dependent dehydrogenase (short-subunit alcohol dehydrogenase family)